MTGRHTRTVKFKHIYYFGYLFSHFVVFHSTVENRNSSETVTPTTKSCFTAPPLYEGPYHSAYSDLTFDSYFDRSPYNVKNQKMTYFSMRVPWKSLHLETAIDRELVKKKEMIS